MLYRRFAVGPLFVLLAGLASAPGGPEAAGAQPLDAVGRIDITAPAGRFVGSGTLIAPGWVLTAGHVIDDASTVTFLIGGRVYAGAEWLAHPLWDGDLLAGADIGLVRLVEPVADVQPAARYAGADELGTVATLAGFATAGPAVIEAWYADGPTGLPGLMLTGGGPAGGQPIGPGDSGGGLFVDLGAGPALAGVHSFVAAGGVAGHTRVASYNAWIDEMLDLPARPAPLAPAGPRGPAPQEATPAMLPVAPEPTTVGLVATGAVVALLRRRRRR